MRKAFGTIGSLLLVTAVWIGGCGEDPATDASPAASPDGGDASEPAAPTACEVMVDERDCDRTKRPIVFVHGSPGTGDSFNHPALLFASNGHCSARIRAVEYDSLAEREVAYAEVAAETTRLIELLLAQTGADDVDLIGHSQGSSHASRYVAQNPGKIAHYVHIGGGQLAQNPGGVPTLCLSSTGDRPVKCATTKNTILQDIQMDHFAVCSSAAAFKEMYKFLNETEREPAHDRVQCGDPIVIEGKAVTFGDNERMLGATIEVYELGESPRERGTPVTTLHVREDGSVGPWTARRGVAYEWKQLPPAGDARAPRYSYFQPFVRSDRLVRFLYESRNPVAAATTQMARLDDGTAALVVRHKQGALLHGRDHLLVGGFEAINEEDAMPMATVVGLYLLDQDADKQSSGGSVLRSTFVNGTDVYLPTDPPAFIELDFNGAKLRVPNWPSKTGGLSLVWFD